MAPPPSTPASHRFLVPKRSATQRNDTPKQLPSGAQQFHATPRFSLHSTPREQVTNLSSSSSTPARPAAFSRQRQTDSISDVVDSSPPDLLPLKTFSDSIEAESIPPSSMVAATNREPSIEESDLEEDAPSPKRRRLSVLSRSEDESESPLVDGSDRIEDVLLQEESPDEHLRLDPESAGGSDTPQSPGAAAQQPTFHRAPRFIPVEQPETSTREPLPDAFSPRRRGTKDVPGGLTAEMRNWLLDIEATTGPKSDGDFVAKIAVNNFRCGLGMILVNGQTVTHDAATRHSGLISNVRVMLAGGGRVVGLARRNEVHVGSHVAIAKPIWEVNLGVEGRWVVACDWLCQDEPFTSDSSEGR